MRCAIALAAAILACGSPTTPVGEPVASTGGSAPARAAKQDPAAKPEPSAKPAPPAASAPAKAADPAPWTPIRLVPVGPPGFYVRPEPATFGTSLTLPAAPIYNPMIEGAVVAVSQHAIYIGDVVAARIVDGRIVEDDARGHLLPRLLEPLTARRIELEAEAAARDEISWGSAILIVDRETPFTTLVDVIYTANRAGFREYQIAVDADTGNIDIGAVLTVSPPKLIERRGKKLEMHPGDIRAFVESDRVLLSRNGERFADLPFDHRDAHDRAALTALAKERVAAIALPAKTNATVVLSALADVSIERVLVVYAQLAGPECTDPAARAFARRQCFFPQRVIEAAG